MSPGESEIRDPGMGGSTSPGQSASMGSESTANQAPPPRQDQPPTNFRTPALRRKSPAVAGILSILPGLGQVYVGHYQRGFIHLIVVGTVISLLSSFEGHGSVGLEPLLGMFISFFWIYNIIDAVRLANFYNEAAAGASPEDLQKQMVLPSRGGSIVGGIVLVGAGFILILNTLFDISLEWLHDWWPAIPIVFGIYLIQKGLKDRQEKG